MRWFYKRYNDILWKEKNIKSKELKIRENQITWILCAWLYMKEMTTHFENTSVLNHMWIYHISYFIHLAEMHVHGIPFLHDTVIHKHICTENVTLSFSSFQRWRPSSVKFSCHTKATNVKSKRMGTTNKDYTCIQYVCAMYKSVYLLIKKWYGEYDEMKAKNETPKRKRVEENWKRGEVK